MPDLFLVVANVAHIQTYIFGSNRLRENIGASYLVDAATGRWAWEIAAEVSGEPVYIRDDFGIWPNPSHTIDRSQAEVIYAAGGNFIALFRDDAAARLFVNQLSRRVLEQAPGLQLMIDSHPYRWGDPLGEAIGSALKRLREARSRQPQSSPLAGSGVTVMCRSTALPAVGYWQPPLEDHENTAEEPLPVSAEVLAKIEAFDEANRRLTNEISLQGTPYSYPRDFEKLGRTHGESSFIAVVHADGNGMGQRVRAIGEQHSAPREYIRAMRDFSQAVARASSEALQDTVTRLLHHIEMRQDSEGRERPFIAERDRPDLRVDLVPIDQHDGYYLPFRPLVFGGDDVTFVCDGRLGLALALDYLDQFSRRTADHGQPSTACAGVAIVKAHYPFARAYELAEALVQSAKQYRREIGAEGNAMDWHFALSGLSDSLEVIRQRQYDVPGVGRLTLRPVTIDHGHHAREWGMVETGLKAFQEKDWAEKRNKQKDLREALRGGPAAVRTFLTIYRAKLPLLNGLGFETEGWQDGRCGYYDALELADLYIPLPGVEEHHS